MASVLAEENVISAARRQDIGADPVAGNGYADAVQQGKRPPDGIYRYMLFFCQGMQRRKFGAHRVDAALDAHHNLQAKGITALGDFLVTAPLKGFLRLWRRQGDPFFIELIQSRRKRGGISKCIFPL